MFSLPKALAPEIILIAVAAVAFLLGTLKSRSARRAAPVLTILALVAALVSQLGHVFNSAGLSDPWQTLQISQFARYFKILTSGIGILLTLLAWPTNEDSTGGAGVYFGSECGEFFGLLLLSVAGVLLVAGANDMMTLFLAVELSSLPTYIMVSISRPQAVAQEAGVKYFFLGAMAAAVLLLGFSYLYGTTGTIYLHGAVDADGSKLPGVDSVVRAAGGLLTAWQMLAVVLLIAGLSFKMVAFPLQVYAADVYQGAATPVTALLSFVPKAAGFAALLKILYAAGGSSWDLPPQIADLIWWIAVLTMTFGNMLGLLQENVKRILAYSSISHSGYMLAGVAALVTAAPGADDFKSMALRGILFYLAIYGITNIAAFGVLSLLPSRRPEVGSSAETLDEIAGMGRLHVGLGLAMSVACFSLIGIPLTAGFAGKVLLIWPAFKAGLTGLVVIIVINSAISAVYYLGIIAAMFLRPLAQPPQLASQQPPATSAWPMPVITAIAASVAATLLLGAAVPVVNRMVDRAQAATRLDISPAEPARPISNFFSVSR